MRISSSWTARMRASSICRRRDTSRRRYPAYKTPP
jgi:hypothetical protein